MVRKSAISTALIGVLSACGGGSAKCELGTDGCGCLEGEIQCRGELVCSDDVCVPRPCPEGDLGCPCLPDESCGDSPTAGNILVCDTGICTDQPCREGIAGCPCLPNGSCDVAADAVCVDGVCEARNCVPGARNCPCGAGGTCDTGLLCQNGALCVDAAGYVGGRCFPDNTCRQGNACEQGVCVPCDTGSRGCSCFADGACEAGLVCVAGTCASEPGEVLQPPAAPKCYSPCQSGLTLADGSYIPCSAEGLIAACLGGTTCVQGTCTTPDGSPRTCASDVDCPDYQACVQGRCYSNCEYDSDCASGLSCYRKVCRIPCVASEDNCASGQHCATTDGDNGYCMPVAAPEGEPQRQVTGTFAVSDTDIGFSNVKTSHVLTITNNNPTALTFKINKQRHVELTEQGARYEETNPLFWMYVGAPGAAAQQQVYEVTIEGDGGTAEVELSHAQNSLLSRWQGTLIIASEIGVRRINVSYVEKPEGRWAGKLYYFAAFGDSNLATWVGAGRPDNTVSTVGNAFIQKWSAFKNGRIRTLDEWQAILTATQTESWSFDSTRAVCAEALSDGACYLYDNFDGWATYSNNLLSSPIPTGVVDFPVVMNLRQDPLGSGATAFEGRIETSGTLQYPGNPGVRLTFANDPTQCTRTSGGACIVDVTSFSAQALVGGRYLTVPGDTSCSRVADFSVSRTPWLVPGFERNTALDHKSGLRYRYECRDTMLPFGDPAEDAAIKQLNMSAAGANPVPDGRTRVRHLELIDGGLVNTDTLFLVVKETFKSFLSSDPADDFSAYGYMLLKRSPADLEAEDYETAAPAASPSPTEDLLQTQCDPGLLSEIGVTSVTTSNVNQVVGLLSEGVSVAAPANEFLVPGSSPYVHYLCVSVKDGKTIGFFDHGLAAKPIDECPGGSTVKYFVSRDFDDTEVSATGTFDCQSSLTCHDLFASWEADCNRGACPDGIRVNPLWRCDSSYSAYCDDNRHDLRAHKLFYKASPSQPQYTPVLVPLTAEIDNAFRYRSRFRSRAGSGLGFAPDVCEQGSDALPYCYDPQAIEKAGKRLECLVSIFNRNDLYGALSSPTALKNLLTINFSWDPPDGDPIHNGYEQLYAELMVMLGDDAYTSAFASRFDLAGSAVRGFEGSLFEPNGIDLSGGAGFEMYRLYQAAQYYQLALDRFYSLVPQIWIAINGDPATRNFVKLGTVTAYFDRLIRASTQKTRAWSEIAKRYQNFNRADLARAVVERAYSSAYMESVILSHLMLRMKNVVAQSQRPTVAKQIQLASLGFRSALLHMNDVYADFTDDVNFFGYAPDYMPFPALDAGDSNAFEKLFASARQKAAVAAEKEATALQSDRSYDTDAVAFQNELTRIKNTYESQLADICGSFLGDDGNVHPAIPKYAYLNEVARQMNETCGFAGNGRIYDALVGLDITKAELAGINQAAENVIAEVNIELKRVSDQCHQIAKLAEYQWVQAGRIQDLESEIQDMQQTIRRNDFFLQQVGQLSSLMKCNFIAGSAAGGDCVTAAIATVFYTTAAQVLEDERVKSEEDIEDKQAAIAQLQKQSAKWTTLQQCDTARIDSEAQVQRILLRLKELDIEALKTQYRIRLGVSEIQKLRQDAQRLVSEQQETEQMTINLEAARNDPNTRIYKNDAILAADRTFQSAVREAYRATKVFEYYTSQSYPYFGDLFLVRMVAHGDITLESYLDGLGDAYAEFEEMFGNPDVRVHVLSVRDDVLRIPRLGPNSEPLSEADRVALFREKVRDVKLLDEHGYINMPFATSMSWLSPLTRNHKMQYIEAEIIGSDIGDTVGRVYLRQKGTGVVRGVNDIASYYAFPERTAVLNPFFNGMRVFVPEVYRNARLKDRPLVNTGWEVVLNQRDEAANQDVNINSLTDIRLYLYYTDFTPF